MDFILPSKWEISESNRLYTNCITSCISISEWTVDALSMFISYRSSTEKGTICQCTETLLYHLTFRISTHSNHSKKNDKIKGNNVNE